MNAHEPQLPTGAKRNPRLVRAFASAARMTANLDPTLETVHRAAAFDLLLARGPRKSRAMGRAALAPIAELASRLDETHVAFVDWTFTSPDDQNYGGTVVPKETAEVFLRSRRLEDWHALTTTGETWMSGSQPGDEHVDHLTAFKPSDLIDKATVTTHGLGGEYPISPEQTIYGALLNIRTAQ